MEGEPLRQWRVAHGLDVAELAARLSVYPATIYRWERGEARPPGMLPLALAELARSLRAAAPAQSPAVEPAAPE